MRWVRALGEMSIGIGLFLAAITDSLGTMTRTALIGAAAGLFAAIALDTAGQLLRQRRVRNNG